MSDRLGRSALFAVLALATSATAATAYADETRAVVVDCEGPHSDEIASRITARLGTNYATRDSSAFRRGLGASSLALAEKGATNDAKLIAHARAGARNSRADAAILVHARNTKRSTILHVWLVNATGDGGPAVDLSIALSPHASVDDETNAVWNAIANALPATPAVAAPVAASPAPPTSVLAIAPNGSTASRADTSEIADPASSGSPGTLGEASRDTGATDSVGRSAHPHAHAIALVRASMQAGTRSFSYVDRITPTLRSYGSSLSPLAAIEGEIYPLARSRMPILSDFGITADYTTAFGISAADSKGNAVSASWNAYDVGARERIPIGNTVLAGIHGGYGAINYSFGDALGPTAQLPSTAYRFVRGGADISVAAGRFTFYGAGSYLNVLSTGPFASVFTRAHVAGIEARAGATRSVGAGFEVALEADYTRFFYSLHPEPGDSYVAGGALDQLARLSLGVARTF